MRKWWVIPASPVKLEKEILQWLDFQSVHPPNVGVEDEDINVNPVFGMLFNWIHSENSLLWISYHWHIRIWFDQKWRPIELDCGIVFLRKFEKRRWNCSTQTQRPQDYRERKWRRIYLSREDWTNTASFHGLLFFRYYRFNHTDKWFPLSSL